MSVRVMGLGFYWVEVTSVGAAVTVDASDAAEAASIAYEQYGQEPSGVHVLPYPAHPRLNNRSGCPAFCHQPNKCKGSTVCQAPFMCDH